MAKNKRRKVNNTTQPYIEDLADELLEDGEKELKEVYIANKKQMDSMVKFVGVLYAIYSRDGVLQGLKTADKKRIQAEYTNKITSVGLNIGKTESTVIKRILKNSVKESHLKTNFIIQAGFSNDLRYSPLSSKQIDDIIFHRINRQTYSDRIWKNKARLLKKLDQQLKASIKTGQSVDKFAKNIKDAFGTKTFETRRIARTEIGFVHSEVSRIAYRDSEAVKKVQWVSELRDNTDDYDASLHGRTWDADGSHPIPIADTHPQCLCVILPLIEGWVAPKNFDAEYKKWKSNK